MIKRRREDSASEESMMEVQISKVPMDMDTDTEENVPPQLLTLMREIVRSGPAELVERNLTPLGFSPLGNHVKGINAGPLVELDKFTTEADARLKQTFMAKVCTITEQMKFLRKQLIGVLEDAKESLELNHVPCNFHKVPGSIYHLYQRPSGQQYFSMLSPSDWKGKPPHQYCGSFLYDFDFSWKKNM